VERKQLELIQRVDAYRYDRQIEMAQLENELTALDAKNIETTLVDAE
jgi:hypothetical protein